MSVHALDETCRRILGTTVAEAVECARTAVSFDPVTICCDHTAATEWGRVDREARIGVADAIDAGLIATDSGVRVQRQCCIGKGGRQSGIGRKAGGSLRFEARS